MVDPYTQELIMGTEPPAEKKEPPATESRETQSDNGGSRSKGYRGNRRYGKPKTNNNKDTVTTKAKFKGAITDLEGYYFDTGPTQAHDFKKTHKKISTYTGTKYSAEVMQSLEEMELHDWTTGMPKKPILSVTEEEGINKHKKKFNHVQHGCSYCYCYNPVASPLARPQQHWIQQTWIFR